MLPSTDGAFCGGLHHIGVILICGNAFNVTASHIMCMEKEHSVMKNMAKWWASAIKMCQATLTAKMDLA